MKRRSTYLGCAIEPHKGHWRVRFRWQGRRYARTTKLAATAENRAQVNRLAREIGATIAAGKDPLALFKPGAERTSTAPKSETVRAYYDRWVADKVPPLVRKAQARDYRKHLGYVLGRLGDIPIADLSARDVLGLRAELLKRPVSRSKEPGRTLSLKYVKNIIAGSLKAMIRDAREIDGIITHDPFVGVRWPRVTIPGPDPFSPDERSRILSWFQAKRFGFHRGGASSGPRLRLHPPFHAYAQMLFWTAMRPSEASGLKWGDVDLKAGIVRVIRSRHMWEDSAPKTGTAARTVRLMPETVRLLRAMQPLHVAPEMRVFTNIDGRPIEPNAFLKRWYDCLRALGIRLRGLYAMKDSYVSTAFTAGVNPAWLEAQTGVRYETLKRHYGQYLWTEGDDQLRKLEELAPRLAPRENGEPELIENTGEK